MKKLIYQDGNLLIAKDVQVISHSCNCQNTFGSGIARSIREMYPEAYAADTAAAIQKINVLGNFSYTKIEPLKHGSSIQYIFNLYGQNLGTSFARNPIRKTNYEALYNALEGMFNVLTLSNLKSTNIGFPYNMGSALGGGSFDIVSRLIEVAFDKYEGNVIIYKLPQ